MRAIVVAGALLAAASSLSAQEQCVVVLDVDGDGEVDAPTDGVLVLRFLFGFTGPALVDAVPLGGCARCDAPEIAAHLASILFRLDVDDDGDLDALGDGVLILRHLLGFTDAALLGGAVDTDHCERCGAPAIGAYVDQLGAAAETPLAVWQPTTVPFDMDCPNGCEQLEHTDVLPHLGVEVTYHYDESVDDPIAQWGDCLASMLECLTGGGGVSACAASASCPAECKALYSSRAPPGADEITLLGVLDGVYVNCGAPCKPGEEVEP